MAKQITKTDNVALIYPCDMALEEAVGYLQEQQELNPKMKLTTLEVELDEKTGNILLHPTYDTITRVRRITGYLSTVPKFNEAKQAEANDRVAHFDDKLMN